MRESKNGKKRWSLARILVIAAVGLIFSLAAAAMYCSGTWNLNRFYDVGEVYDSTEKVMGGMIYDQATGEFIIKLPEATETYAINKKGVCWNYLYVYVGGLEEAGLHIKTEFYDTEGNYLDEIEETIYNGENMIPLSGLECKNITFVFENAQEVSYYIYKIQVRETIKSFDIKEYGLITVLVFVFYCGIVWAAVRVIRIRGWKCKPIRLGEGLQAIYRYAWEPAARRINGMEEAKRSRLRILCMCFVLLNLLVITGTGNYNITNGYNRWYILAQLTALCVMSGLYLRSDLQNYCWRSGIMMYWLIFCIMMCISDFFVAKSAAVAGVWMLLGFSMIYWCYSNCLHPEKILRELARAYEIVFFLSCIYSLLFIKYSGTGGYLGVTPNQNTLGGYAGIAVALVLALLDDMLLRTGSWKRVGVLSVEAVTAVYFAAVSESRAAFLCVCIMFVLLVTKHVFARRNKAYHKRTAVALFICLCVGFVEIPLLNWGIRNLPDKFNTVVYAQETDSEKVIENLTRLQEADRFTSGRLTIWENYITDMNLLGHYGNAVIDGVGKGQKMGPHNMLLTIPYRYGCFAIIPYAALGLYALKYALLYMKKYAGAKGKYAFMPLAVVVAWFVLAAFDNIEQPLRHTSWIYYYLMLGFLAAQAKRRIR